MKFITVRDFRTYPKKIWKELLDIQEMIVTNNGKPIAMLTPIIGSDIEYTIKAVRQAKAKLSVEKMREISVRKKSNTFTQKEINSIIKQTRTAKK
jgi:antitoxin (DNA-binding transcriptional repressor) of toxin-antitoxin stability system